MTKWKPEPIDELRRRYKDEWLVVLVTNYDRNGLPSEGILLARCPDKFKVHETILALRAQGETGELYSFFAGPTIPEGWEAVLHGCNAF
ncbi:MAG: hypothetical protein NZ805_01450 [Armatimonadetes bacterium]|nr:hypothetical protein [Armatimonadota bacterium]MDW8027598.1 hypothetical protein [Armatimonadota bacterium]